SLYRRSDDHPSADTARAWLSDRGDRGSVWRATTNGARVAGRCGRAVRSDPSPSDRPAARSWAGAGGRDPGQAAGWDRLGGAGDAGDDPALARWGDQSAPRWRVDRPLVRARAGVRAARTVAGVRGWVRGVRE